MSDSTFICAREECGKVTERKKHNQKYCSDACTRIATNARIMERYYEDKKRLRGAQRYCIKCGETKLSRYNPSKVCSACQKQSETDMANEVLDLLESTHLIIIEE